MIVEKINDAKQRKIKQYPVNSNRASDLGHPCVRYHVLNRTRWQERSLHTTDLQLIFDLGSEIEQITLKDLAEAGVVVFEQQRAFEWKEYQITGHVDGFILLNNSGPACPLEIKSMSPFVWQAVNTVDDMKRGKYPYLRKYPTQLNLYMLMKGIEKGVFLLKNKVSGAYKEIWMDLDYQLGEETLQRAESINKHVTDGTLPNPINDPVWCDNCPFAHICLPDQIGKEVEIDTTELSALLDRLDTLKLFAREYDETNDEVKTMVRGREKILAGDWFVTGKWIERKGGDPYWKSHFQKVPTK